MANMPLRYVLCEGQVLHCSVEKVYQPSAEEIGEKSFFKPGNTAALVVLPSVNSKGFDKVLVPVEDVFFESDKAEAALSQRMVYAVLLGSVVHAFLKGRRTLQSGEISQLPSGASVKVGDMLCEIYLMEGPRLNSRDFCVAAKDVFPTYEQARQQAQIYARSNEEWLGRVRAVGSLNLKYEDFQFTALNLLSRRGPQSIFELLEAVRAETSEASVMRAKHCWHKFHGKGAKMWGIIAKEWSKAGVAHVLPSAAFVLNLKKLKEKGLVESGPDRNQIRLSARGHICVSSAG